MNGGFKNKRSSSVASLENSNLVQSSLPTRPQDKLSPITPGEPRESYGSLNSSKQILRTFELSNISMNTVAGFPLDLDISGEVQNALAAGLLRNIQNNSSKLFNRACKMLFEKRYLKMVNLLFWTIFVLKFQTEADASLLAEMRSKLSKIYGKYFSSLSQPKEEISNLGIMTAGYICHVMFYNLFPKERSQFDMRFILNCYHIVIHELNGIFVSDYYIQNSIERLFGNKFFFYEDTSDEKTVVEKKDLRDEPLLRNLSYNFRDFSQIPGGVTFAKELANRLKVKTKKFKPPTLKELPDRPVAKSAVSSPRRNIMKLTEIEDHGEPSSARESPFPKLKLNYHQISPTVSAFLDNSTNSLPCQRKVLINYSNNKPAAAIESVSYETKKADEDTLKHDKKERAKNKAKGTVIDYSLKNRGEDYYLNHIPKTLRDKFRDELDLKYVLDNVKVSLRGSYTVRDSKEVPTKKFHLTNAKETKAITEQDDEASIIKKGSEIIQNDLKLETNSQEEKDSTKDDLLPAYKDLLQEKLSIDKTSREIEGLHLPKLVSNKSKNKLPRTISMVIQASDVNKLIDINKKPGSDAQESEDKVENLFSEMTDQAIPKLRYKNMENRRLGKGKAFASLERKEDIESEDKRTRETFVYKDRRAVYTKEHSKIAKGNIDANIEDLVHKLLVKQNVFSRNFGRYAGQNLSVKK